MKILITSGGTTQPIDSVRGITNHATGTLGREIAEIFLENGHEVCLVTTPNSNRPNPHDHLQIIEIKTVDDLLLQLEPLVKHHHVLIHSMAVSDYSPVYMTNLEEVQASTDLNQLLTKTNQETKISSHSDYQVLFLKKTPKVISLVKEWNPNIRLLGFKLLVQVSKEELFAVARDSLKKNKADYILANDLVDIHDQQHLAYLVDEKNATPAHTKSEIAQLIYDTLSKREGE